MENTIKGNRQGEVCADIWGLSSVQNAAGSITPGASDIQRATGLRNTATPYGEKRYQYLCFLLPLTVTRSFHVPGVVFTLLRLH